MTDDELRANAQFVLNQYAGFNGGRGLVVNPAMAKMLSGAGVSGFYEEALEVKGREIMKRRDSELKTMGGK